MKKLIVVCLLALPCSLFAQERKLKTPQPSIIELTMFEIRLNPNDTIFNNVSFNHLPVKGFPFFTADSQKAYYTIEQRDSVLRKIDEMFFEEQ